MRRLFAKKEKSAFYKKLLEKSTTRADEIADEMYQKYAKEIFEGMEDAAEKGCFEYWHRLRGGDNKTALDELKQELRSQGFYVKEIYDDWCESTYLLIKWWKT